MKLKNIIIAMASILAAANFTACSVEDAVQFPVIATKQAVYQVEAEGGEVTVAIESNISWTASMAAATSKDVVDDVKLLTEKGTSSTKELKLSMGANSGYNRGVIITLTGRDVSTAFQVKQAGALGERLDAVTIAEFNDLPDDDKNVYQVAGIVSGVKTDGSDKYGNFYISDKTGKLYIYGFVGQQGGSTKNFVNVQAEMGLKDGDYMIVQGSRSVYKNNPQLVNAWYMRHYPYKTAAEFNALEDNDDIFYTVSGKVKSIANSTYGNIYLEDETGEVYIYGTLNWNGETKKFSELGIKVGDTVTGYTIKTSYNGSAQGKNMQVVLIESEENGGGDDNGGDSSQYSSNVKFTMGSSAYDNSEVTVNGVAKVYNVKLGSSTAFGDATATLPAGTKKITFYSVAWKGAPASLKFTIGDVEKSIDVAANNAASGSGPYEFNLSASDKYEIVLDSALAADTEMKVETYEGNNTGKRAFVLGVNAEK